MKEKLEKVEAVEPKTFGERLKIFEEFRTAKSKILSPEDFIEVTIKDRKTGELKKKRIILKSGWRKIKLFFGISSEIIELKREKDEDKIIYMCKARVYTQSGISSEAVGICSSDEPGKANMNEYILSSIAQTRAINKAIADLVGADFDEDIIEEDEEDFEQKTGFERKPYEQKTKSSEKIISVDKNSLIAQIFEMIREISDHVPRYEIFSRIKKRLNIDEKSQLRFSELEVEQLKSIIDVLTSMMKQKEKTDEEFFF